MTTEVAGHPGPLVLAGVADKLDEIVQNEHEYDQREHLPEGVEHRSGDRPGRRAR